MKFENNFHFTIFNQGKTFPILDVYNREIDSEKIDLTLQYTGEWIDGSETSEKLSDVEEIVSQHSENCYNRWKDIVPLFRQN